MKIAITGASGFVGRALVLRLSQKAHSVQPVSLRQGLSPHSFSDCDAVVHLAGEPVAQRWTSAVRQRIMNSRVDGTRMVVEALRNSPARILTLTGRSFASTMNVRRRHIVEGALHETTTQSFAAVRRTRPAACAIPPT